MRLKPIFILTNKNLTSFGEQLILAHNLFLNKNK